MNIWDLFTFWLLWIMLLWTWVCRYLFESLLSVFVGIHPEVELQDTVVILCLTFWGTVIVFHSGCTILRSHHSAQTFLIFCFLCFCFASIFWRWEWEAVTPKLCPHNSASLNSALLALLLLALLSVTPVGPNSSPGLHMSKSTAAQVPNHPHDLRFSIVQIQSTQRKIKFIHKHKPSQADKTGQMRHSEKMSFQVLRIPWESPGLKPVVYCCKCI